MMLHKMAVFSRVNQSYQQLYPTVDAILDIDFLSPLYPGEPTSPKIPTEFYGDSPQ